jgi:uncharacterized protein YjbJ (UPF0337 family)
MNEGTHLPARLRRGTSRRPHLFFCQVRGAAEFPVSPRDVRRRVMGELTDKIKGNVNEVIGKAKQRSKDPSKRDEGAAQEGKGKAQQFIGKVKGALGDDI